MHVNMLARTASGHKKGGIVTPEHEKEARTHIQASEFTGSPGRIRTCDTLINSQLRYHCATGEYVLRCLRARKNYTHMSSWMQPKISKNIGRIN